MSTDENNTAEAPPNNGTSASRWLKVAVGVLILGVLIFFGREASRHFLELGEWVQGQGTLGPVIFVAGYAVGTVAAAPGALLTLFGGAIFGLVWGTVWVFCGAVLGSSASFLIARYLARGAVEKKVRGHEKFAAIDRAVGEQGLKIVFLLRLTPVFPFSLGNYALGLTRVRFVHYVLGSLGMLPGTFLYVYYGKTVGDLAALAAGTVPAGGTEKQALLAAGLVATILVTVVITRIAAKALKEATETTADNEVTDDA